MPSHVFQKIDNLAGETVEQRLALLQGRRHWGDNRVHLRESDDRSHAPENIRSR